MKTKKEKKAGLFSAIKMLWQFMTTKEKVEFVVLILLSCFPAFINIYMSMIPSLLIAKFANQEFLIFGFIDFLGLGYVEFFFTIFGVLIVMYTISMIVLRAVDIFTHRLMYYTNKRVEEILLLERKNLDINMTIGEANYIAKNAIDNIYYIIV